MPEPRPVGHHAPTPTLSQIVDALILFDSPILDERFQEAIAMHPDAATRAALATLPATVAEGSRVTRRAAIEWERTTGGTMLEDEFRRRAELFLLDALVEGAEVQIRLKAFMSREAPTQEVRVLIEEAIAHHRALVEQLRAAISRLTPVSTPARPGGPVAFVGAETTRRDLRSEVEDAIRAMRASGKEPRALVLSATALRHLRDQGLFAGGEDTVLKVAVQVEFAWPGSSFALLSFDSVQLAEILEEQRAPPRSASRPPGR